MRTVLVTDKPFISKRLIDAFSRSKSDREFVVSLHPTSIVGLNRRFHYPRGLAWSAYPFVGAPQYKPLDLMDKAFPPSIWPSGATPMGTIEDLHEVFREVDQVVLALDPDASSELMLEHIVHGLVDLGLSRECMQRLILRDFTDAAMAADIDSMSRYSPNAPLLHQARIRKHFDYGFDVNSLAIFGKAMRLAGTNDDTPMSKFMLQLLYAIRSQPGSTDGELVSLMSGWKGTGRYDVPSLNLFGSPVSRGQIILNLVASGLVRSDGRKNALSDAGERFLEILHPDSEDPDLPFRLQEWQMLPPTEARERIDTYLRTFFGKTKRRLDAMR